MKSRNSVLALWVTVFVCAAPSAGADAPAAAPAVVKVISCNVQSTRDAAIKHDCTGVAAQVCDGSKQICELPIGMKLTEGKNIDPPAGIIGRRVTVKYECGGVTRQRGPYIQSDNATLILECMGPR